MSNRLVVSSLPLPPSRQKAVDSGLKKAIEVPLTIIRIAHDCWPHLETLAEHGNIAAITDLQVRFEGQSEILVRFVCSHLKLYKHLL